MIKNMDIAHLRLENQLITRSILRDPADIVAHLEAVQAQDYGWSLWAIGLRSTGPNENEIEKAIGDRRIVRTWLGRGTLHFAAAGDLRWMLELFAERNIAGAKSRFKQLGIDDGVISDSRRIITKHLRGGNQLPRETILEVLETAHISTQGQRGIHILWRMAQEGLICFGPRQGKKYTFVLLDEWVPEGERMSREEALQKLALQYMNSHGPATLQDFAWWSGLMSKDAAAGLELAKPSLIQDEFTIQSYWRMKKSDDIDYGHKGAILLPAFDEYLVGYKDRSAVLDPKFYRKLNDGGGIIKPTILIDGTIRGTWKKKFVKGACMIIPEWFEEPGLSYHEDLAGAAKCYGEFLNMPVSIT